MKPYSEQVDEPRASGVDNDVVTKEQLASAVASLSSSVNEFVSVANVLLAQFASERKGNENAASGQ